MMPSSEPRGEPFMSTLLSNTDIVSKCGWSRWLSWSFVPSGNDPIFGNDIRHVSRSWADFLGLPETEMRLLWSIKVTDDSEGTEG